MRKLKRLAAIMMATTMMVGLLGMNASAEDIEVKIDKTLEIKDATNASVPTTTFNFVATTEGLSRISATENNPEILVGIGTPTIASISYAPTDNIVAGSVVKSATVTFGDDCAFVNPGIYRYKITETAGSNNDITYDSTARYLDVYVEYVDVNDTSKGVEIKNYVVFAGEANATPTEQTIDGELKNVYTTKKGFENSYATHVLKITKTVEGNMGDKDLDFNFTVSFENGPVSGKAVIYVNGETDGTEISFDADGKASTSFNLAHGQNAEIKGLPYGTKYTVVENNMTGLGYTTEFKIGTDVITNSTTIDNEYDAQQKEIANEDVTVDVTNTKSVNTPTGVITTFAPYIIMVALAAVVAFFFLRRRRASF